MEPVGQLPTSAVRRGPGGMAAPLRALAVAGGGESSESEDDGWEIGYLDRTAQKLKGPLPVEERQETFKKALTTGNISLVEELLDSGISVDTSFQYGWTSLMYAASVSNVQLVRVLLDRGANASFDKVFFSMSYILPLFKQPFSPYLQALTWAARQGHKNVVLKLLELGANKMIQTKDGKTPSEIAKRNKHLEIFSLLSLTLNSLEGKFHQLTKEESICKLLRTDSDKEKDHLFSSYTAFGDLELFLHGLGLEHMTDLLKEREITLRHLLTMRKDELAKNGITSRDQQKIMAALKELEVEEIKFGELPEVAKLEISGDEFLNFLLKLNKQCGHLIAAVQNIITELPVNSHKIVLEWASPRNFTSVCEELVSNVEDLSEEVCKLKDLIQKLQNERENDPTHIPLMEEVSTWNSRILKRTAITVCGFGFLLFICKLTFQRK
ncbi:hypothetical protein FD755_012554 [Muntiacus reevesi]|uniref:Ankyrin repeat, SAM and basic leucine zipper domain-containing protein 1 n=1 Tax=Muntiacus reevesi TaxID=9886 RepID=A0A5N3XTR0_MUNRE|nr:hypothetical protein FD755_012554 [Muntiacus reevesi]